MNSQIKFQKQNISFEAEPNVAKPHVEILDGNLVLSFVTKKIDIEARIIFTEPLMYRIGSPNDEGFYGYDSDPRIKNNSIYSRKNFPTLDFGDFHQVTGVDWKNNLLGEGTEVLDEKYKDKEGFSHYVFFMKDGTFECIARGYEAK